MPYLRQTSFAAGEIAPTLWGRSDLDKYHVALKRCRNFFISRQGAAYSRPGTTYVGAPKFPGQGPIRLIPFVYSDSLTFVLEFGNLYVRMWNAGTMVVEVATPYVLADLPKLKAAQQGAVLTLCHPSYPPAELTYNGGALTNWSYAAITFDRPAGVSAGPFFEYLGRWSVETPTYSNPIDSPTTGHTLKEWQWAVTEVWLNAKGQAYETKPFVIVNMGLPFYTPYDGRITYHLNSYVAGVGAQAGHNYQSLQNGNQGHALTDGAWWTLNDTAQSPAPNQFDAVPASTTQSGASLQAGVVCDAGRPVQVVLTNQYSQIGTDPNFIGFRIYRGQGGIYGWVGDTRTASFTDIGNVPDYTRQPPQGTNPFKFYNAAGALISTEYPAACTFFDGRRLFAGTAARPDSIFGSVVNDYANFDTPYVPTASSSILFALASRKLEQIRFLVGVGPKLLAGTNSSAWGVFADQGPLAYNNIDAKKQVEIGSSWVEPLVIDGTALFIRTKGAGVRSLAYDYMRGSFVGSDVSLLASHMVIGYQLTDWCYAEDPWSLVYAVRSDGTMLCLTYIKDEGEIAWSTFDTPGGKFESVCSVPEGNEDAVYCVVNRTLADGSVVRYIERFASRVITTANINQAVCLDAAGIYSGAATTTISGLVWPNGQVVWALADGNVVGPLTVQGGAVTLPLAASYVVVGLLFTPQLQQLDPALAQVEAKTLMKIVNRVGVEVDNTRGLSIGPDFTHLVDWPQRQVSDSYGTIALASTITNQWVSGAWGIDRGAVCIQQNNPLPVTVFGITREIQLGGA